MTNLPDRERIVRIERAAARLSRFHRTLLIMAAAEKRSFAEIASTLKITERQVERNVAKALLCFDHALEREENPLLFRRWLRFWRRRR